MLYHLPLHNLKFKQMKFKIFLFCIICAVFVNTISLSKKDIVIDFISGLTMNMGKFKIVKSKYLIVYNRTYIFSDVATVEEELRSDMVISNGFGVIFKINVNKISNITMRDTMCGLVEENLEGKPHLNIVIKDLKKIFGSFKNMELGDELLIITSSSKSFNDIIVINDVKCDDTTEDNVKCDTTSNHMVLSGIPCPLCSNYFILSFEKFLNT